MEFDVAKMVEWADNSPEVNDVIGSDVLKS